jgi:hypothetical protein
MGDPFIFGQVGAIWLLLPVQHLYDLDQGKPMRWVVNIRVKGNRRLMAKV